MCLQFAGIVAALAAAVEVLALPQMCLPLGGAIERVGVAVLQLLSLRQRHHGAQLYSVKDADYKRNIGKKKLNLNLLVALAGMNAARRVGHTIVR